MQNPTTLRLAMLANSYQPVPIRTGRKYPTIDNWQHIAAAVTPETVVTWPDAHANHAGTGVLCGNVLGLDIDVLDARLSSAVEMLAMDMLGLSPLRRVGQAPKVLLVYRAADPTMRKLSTPALHLPGKIKVQVEVLASGEQFVAFGIHPDTEAPYAWAADADPTNTAVIDLPTIGESELREFLTAAEALLRTAGAAGLATGVSSAPTTRGPRSESALAAPSAAAVVALLERMPNPADTGRDEYVRVMLSARGCVQGLEADGRLEDGDADLIGDAAVDWAERWEGGSEHNERAKWDDDWSRRDAPLAGWRNLQEAAARVLPGYAAEAAADEFAAVPMPPAALSGPTDWMSMLQRGKPTKDDREGPIKGNLTNACVALHFAPEWFGRLTYSLFSNTVLLDGDGLRDADITRATVWLQRAGINVASAVTAEAIMACAERNPMHPVRDYLSGLVWDGVQRIDMWLAEYLGAKDTPFNRAVSSRFLISMVARVMDPGCQVDTMLILEGRQGLMKSSALRALANGWFTDHMPDITSKDAPLQLMGVWLVEFAELDKLNKQDVARVKSFITSGTDRLRKPFGKVAEDFKRQSVFAGTVNPGGRGYLQDETGGRRFWPVACGAEWDSRRRADIGGIIAARDQLWAESAHRYNAGAAWWLNSDDLEVAQEQVTSERYADDIWADRIREYIADLNDTCMDDIMTECLRVPVDRWSHVQATRAGRVLRGAGWSPRQVRVPGSKTGQRQHRFFRDVPCDIPTQVTVE